MKGQRLYKKEKLCSTTAIDALFTRGGRDILRAMAYPVRAVWRENTRRYADCPQFLIMVPKKRVRHAVDRVTMRRRIREAYRLNRDLMPRDRRLDIALIYVADTLLPYADIDRAIKRLLTRIADSQTSPTSPTSPMSHP